MHAAGGACSPEPNDAQLHANGLVVASVRKDPSCLGRNPHTGLDGTLVKAACPQETVIKRPYEALV